MIPGIFGGIGRLEIAPFNGPDDPFPTWLDITTFVRAEETPLEITRGRQTELDSIQSSQLTCLLDNSDNRFTPGYTAGPYGANWTTGKPVRYSETIGARTFYHFTGFVEFPEADSWQPIGYQEIQLSAVDRLTRLARTPAYVSTLGAHIMANGGTPLKSYYPMNDPAAPFLDVLGYGPPMTVKLQPNNASGGTAYTNVTGAAAVNPASVAMAVGDDTSVVAVTMQTGTFSGSIVDVADVGLTINYEAAGKSIAIASGQTLTIVCWFNIDPSALCTTIAETIRTFINSAVGVGFDIIELDIDASGATNSGNWDAHHAGGPDFFGGKGVGSHWVPIALRYSWSPQTFEFWFADQAIQSGAWTGSPPGTLSVAQIYVTQLAYAGALGHLQVYVGDPTAYTHTMFLAQMQMGLNGLEYQTTGQRVTTILNYAGVPTGLQNIDNGSGFMSKAALSGTTAKNQLDLATVTEQGRLFVDGQGHVVFHGRDRVYNV